MVTNGGFHGHGVYPENGWVTREHLIKMHENWGYTHFRKPPFDVRMNIELSVSRCIYSTSLGSFMIFHTSNYITDKIIVMLI